MSRVCLGCISGVLVNLAVERDKDVAVRGDVLGALLEAAEAAAEAVEGHLARDLPEIYPRYTASSGGS